MQMQCNMHYCTVLLELHFCETDVKKKRPDFVSKFGKIRNFNTS